MAINSFILYAYGGFLLLLLVINLLYVFQVFTYRLPGDASIPILTIHLILVFAVLTISTLFIGL